MAALKNLISSIIRPEHTEIIKTIKSIHDAKNLDFNLEPMMGVIKKIFHLSNLTSKMDSQENGLAMSSEGATFGFQKEDNNLRVIIHRLSWEIICKGACGKAAKDAALDLLGLLRAYCWEVKVVLVLAAFAMNYGQFWTNANSSSENHLAQSVCLFLKPPCLLKETDYKKSHFNSLKNLVEQMLAVANLMVDLKVLSKKHKFPLEVSDVDHLLYGVYQIITSVYTCFSYNMKLVEIDSEGSSWTNEIKVMEYYTGELNKVRGYLSQLYQKQDHYIFETEFNRQHESIVHLITTFYKQEDSKQCLGIGSRKVSFDYLNGKTVVFVISHWNVDMKNFESLKEIYDLNKEKNSKYEIVWIPIVEDKSSYHQISFERKGASMNWPWLCNPLVIRQAFLGVIRKKCHFHRKPILINVDAKFQFVYKDAFPDVLFWRKFTININPVEDVKKNYPKPIWTLFLELHRNIEQWVKDKVVCLYGGQDDEWVKEFEKGIIECKKKVNMEIVYIGTSRAKTDSKLKKIIQTCGNNKWQNQLWKPNIVEIEAFWKRVTLLYQMMTNSNVDPVNDAIMKELRTILSYDYSEDGWAIMFGGSSDNMVISGGQQLTQCLINITSWGSVMQGPADFVSKMKAYYQRERHTVEHCISQTFPATAVNIDQEVPCFICGQSMEKIFLYKCCTKWWQPHANYV